MCWVSLKQRACLSDLIYARVSASYLIEKSKRVRVGSHGRKGANARARVCHDANQLLRQLAAAAAAAVASGKQSRPRFTHHPTIIPATLPANAAPSILARVSITNLRSLTSGYDMTITQDSHRCFAHCLAGMHHHAGREGTQGVWEYGAKK